MIMFPEFEGFRKRPVITYSRKSRFLPVVPKQETFIPAPSPPVEQSLSSSSSCSDIILEEGEEEGKYDIFDFPEQEEEVNLMVASTRSVPKTTKRPKQIKKAVKKAKNKTSRMIMPEVCSAGLFDIFSFDQFTQHAPMQQSLLTPSYGESHNRQKNQCIAPKFNTQIAPKQQFQPTAPNNSQLMATSLSRQQSQSTLSNLGRQSRAIASSQFIAPNYSQPVVSNYGRQSPSIMPNCSPTTLNYNSPYIEPSYSRQKSQFMSVPEYNGQQNSFMSGLDNDRYQNQLILDRHQSPLESARAEPKKKRNLVAHLKSASGEKERTSRTEFDFSDDEDSHEFFHEPHVKKRSVSPENLVTHPNPSH
ncbi:hypothetical protein G6F56_000265 [Rhizopus delemar]|nr:hypothetical protein G6F56_000265 [Rhizopus delemar]